MTDFAADTDRKFKALSATRDQLRFKLVVDIGSTGAPTVQYKDDPKITITRAGVGDYDLTFPKCVSASIVLAELYNNSAPATMVVTAKDAGAGTASIQFYDAATPGAVELASGADITLYIDCETRSRDS